MKHIIIPYQPYLKDLARQLRTNSTLSEILLWQEIKERKLLGFQFHRQVPMLDFIVDFYCHELSLAIEIDGSSHTFTYKEDLERQAKLEQHNVRFLRFDDLEVKKNLPNVLRSLEQWIRENRKV
ncbi:endonuclease domain-containing protein [Pontibacter akesuensis]|uniref:Very-short-patch-repair endonuclease n=1 Tax=Pontibacter akesuensis TaxID=388950 RepID=A0A1I7KS50_9BACT|nr:DUF559 domain-containing protein [Pontibacter akesuensis]GHA80997.1 hypothetical protein GCM10007389_39430 [Pontibacter akesuensis]SFV00302.1 Very-short-patch-repair endonuclease [Pontibacter akesuensis]